MNCDYRRHEAGLDADAGFDGGEFSSKAHYEALADLEPCGACPACRAAAGEDEMAAKVFEAKARVLEQRAERCEAKALAVADWRRGREVFESEARRLRRAAAELRAMAWLALAPDEDR